MSMYISFQPSTHSAFEVQRLGLCRGWLEVALKVGFHVRVSRL